jgi:hypothetical protein
MFVREEGPQGPVPGGWTAESRQREGKKERNKRWREKRTKRRRKKSRDMKGYRDGGTGRNMKHQKGGISKEEKRGRGRRRKESLWRLRKGRGRMRN